MSEVETTVGTELCCRICRVKVCRVRGPNGFLTYLHSTHPALEEHEVEPVAMATADVIHVCDFCLVPHPGWVFPLNDHATTESAPHPEHGFTMTAVDVDGWWAACRLCMELVITRQIGKLRDRAFVAAAESQGRPLDDWEKDSIIGRLAAFWLAVPGPPVEIM